MSTAAVRANASADRLDLAPLPVDAGGHRSTGWWGTVLLIATEASLFAYLLASYFYLASMAPGPFAGAHGAPALRLALPNTALLVASSGAMWWAESGIALGKGGRLGIGLALTVLLGTLFLGVQLYEYGTLPFRAGDDAYASLFWTITGFHAAHVFVGLLAIGVVLLRARLGHFTAERHHAVTNVSWYWHFVDVVWLFVFASLYLSPRVL